MKKSELSRKKLEFWKIYVLDLEFESFLVLTTFLMNLVVTLMDTIFWIL